MLNLNGESRVEFEILWEDKVVADVVIDLSKKKDKVQARQYTDHPIMKPFPRGTDNLKLADIYDFFEDRCFPRTRANADEILVALGLAEYEPFLIVQKTHGVQFDDFLWIRFKGEDLKHDDVKVRD